MCFPEVGLKMQGLAIICNRFVKFPQVRKSQAEVVVRIGERRLEADGFAIAGDRLRHFALDLVSHSKIAEDFRIVGFEAQCLGVAADRLR